MATSVPKGIAAEEPSTQRIRFIRKKSANTMLQNRGGQRTKAHRRIIHVRGITAVHKAHERANIVQYVTAALMGRNGIQN